ncbi:hypothetical protein [Epilithonimonas sp.]|uniref:hypothetical protein n=1 Tax=Epilithonimonas sp. TaxID=2894511 RepID=UPI002FDDDB9F
MKKYLYLFFISFSLTNCYTYKVSTEADEATQDKTEPKRKSEPKEKSNVQQLAASSMALDGQVNPAVNSKGHRSAKINKDKMPKPTSVTEKLEVGKFFRIDVADKSYKIQVDKWESDTLVAHVIHKPKKILKFHKNQINQSTIAERRFSQPVADIITVAAYAGIGVGIWALVR